MEMTIERQLILIGILVIVYLIIIIPCVRRYLKGSRKKLKIQSVQHERLKWREKIIKEEEDKRRREQEKKEAAKRRKEIERRKKEDLSRREKNKKEREEKEAELKREEELKNNETKTISVIEQKQPIDSNKDNTETSSKIENDSNPEIEPNSKKFFVKYLPPNELDQVDPWKYPLVKFPKTNCIVRSYQEGSTKRKGFKEPFFQEALENYFSNYFEISGNLRLNTGSETRPYEPDIALIDHKSGLNIRIDIEIDEPYAGLSRKATHCLNEDNIRDIFFADRGWIVVRFTEHQIHIYEKECLAYLAEIISKIYSGYSISNELINVNKLLKEDQWDILQAQQWEKEKYRENYLGHEFGDMPDSNDVFDRKLNDHEIEEEKHVISTKYGDVDVSNPTGYNKVNLHTRDDRIKFYPENHLYTIDGIEAPSASTIVSKFFPGFNPYSAASKIGPGHELYGFPEEEIVRKWNDKGEKAARDGTFLHSQIEKYYLKEDYSEPVEFNFFLDFVNDHNQLKPYRTEWRIFDANSQIAGTIDLIAKNGGGYELYDWKRSKKILNGQGEPIVANRWQQGIGNLDHIDDTSYNRYCLQQSIYKYILESNYGLKINNMYLVVIHPNYDRYYKVKVNYMKEELQYMLKTL